MTQIEIDYNFVLKSIQHPDNKIIHLGALDQLGANFMKKYEIRDGFNTFIALKKAIKQGNILINFGSNLVKEFDKLQEKLKII